MEQIIITKQNNTIKKTKTNNSNYYNFYQTENLIEQLKLEKFIKNKNEITIVNRFIQNLLQKPKYKNNIEEITSILKSKNIDKEILCFFENIINSIDDFISNYSENRKDYVQACLKLCTKLNNEIIIKIIIKELINIYTKNIIDNLSLSKLNNLYMMIIRSEDINELLYELNIEINNKYTYILEKSLTKNINSVYIKKFPHLCWENCENTTNCDKMDDRLRKLITNYDFITNGYQILIPKINEKNETKYKIDTFYVAKCKNYKKKTRIK